MQLFRLDDPIGWLRLALAAFTIFYIVALVRAIVASRRAGADAVAAFSRPEPSPGGLGIGAVTNFFDTLGIGSFATTTSIYRAGRVIPDELIPGTLNVGHTLPAITQAFIYTTVIPVDPVTLISMIAAAVAGAWLGAGVVAGWDRRKIQLGMGLCLLGAATLMLSSLAGILPAGGTLQGVTGVKLAIGVTGNFILGALMTLGIGLYAPCLILVSLLGMNATVGFPIMMGSCAFLMPVASARFIRERKFHLGAALGLIIGGLPAVLVAALIVKSLPLTAVRWLVVVVVVYTAITMLLASQLERAVDSASPRAA
ncbi:MAG: permease [Gemmatimonadota bacterium]